MICIDNKEGFQELQLRVERSQSGQKSKMNERKKNACRLQEEHLICLKRMNWVDFISD